MRKKILISTAAVAGAVFICLMLFVFKGNDEMTFFQRQTVNQYLAASPFEQDESGNNKTVPIAVAAGIDGYGFGEFLGVRNQIDYLSGCIEVKVAVTDKNEVVLAESYSAIKESPVSLSRVIAQLGERGKLVVNLSEYSRLSAVNSAIINNGYLAESIVTGVDENAVEYVKRFFPKVKVLCDWNGENERSLEDIASAGADGVLCTQEVFDKKLVEKARDLDLAVWVNCAEDIYTTVEALKFGAAGIITLRPDFAMSVSRDWNEGTLKGFLSEK